MAKKAVPAFDSTSVWGTYRPQGAVGWIIRICHAIPTQVHLLYRLVILLRWPLKANLDHPLDVEVWGKRMRFLPRGNISEGKLLFSPQFFDTGERNWLRQRVPAGGVFLDIGANAGGYSFWIRSCLGEDTRILAVEPDPEMRRRIEFNLATEGIRNIEVCPEALSDHQGEAVFQVKEAQRGQNVLRDVSGGGSLLRGRRAMKVQTDTLLHLLQSRGVTHVDALKIDIEGHESRVFRHFFANAPTSLWPSAILTEVKDDTESEIRQILESHNYRQTGRTKLNGLFDRRH